MIRLMAKRRKPKLKGGEASQRMHALKRYGCVPPPCRTLDDMTKAEIRRLERELGAKVVR